ARLGQGSTRVHCGPRPRMDADRPTSNRMEKLQNHCSPRTWEELRTLLSYNPRPNTSSHRYTNSVSPASRESFEDLLAGSRPNERLTENPPNDSTHPFRL